MPLSGDEPMMLCEGRRIELRKLLLSLAVLALLMAAPALAETYAFPEIHASVTLPDNTYELVLTPGNLQEHTAYLAAQNMDYDATLNAFEADGVLLKALDTDNDRTLVITALKDVDAQNYFDLNKQDEDMRREFRMSHTDGSVYGVLGYSYSSAAWKKYSGDVLRFLQTKYTLHQDGHQVCAGYQRRTIRNGYTITLDMQVTGRKAKDADNTALEKVMKNFSFTQILPMPELPIKLAISSPPPTETDSNTFTIKGTTAKKAKVTATVFSLGSSGSQTVSKVAGSDGAFSMKVTLPSQGVFSVTITAEAQGAITAQRIYAVTYQRGLLPVDLHVVPGEILGDTTTIAGTTASGAKATVSVNGPIVTDKSSTKSNFNFSIDTSKEGTYTIVLTITKKGLDTRSFSYTATRTYTDVEKLDKIRDRAKKIDYSNLKKDANQGKTVVNTGYITDISATIANEWVVTFALNKTGSGYKNIIYVIANEQPILEVGDKAKLYGTISGTYSLLNENGDMKTYPRIIADFFEAVD